MNGLTIIRFGFLLPAAVVLGAQSITLGLAEVVIAGGMESMSNAPYVLPRTSKKNPVGHVNLQDSILSDGLWDPHKKLSMGSIAESTAREMGISRQQQVRHVREGCVERFVKLFVVTY